MVLDSENMASGEEERAPTLFAKAVREAGEGRLVGRLGLLGLEAREYGWGAEGLRLVEAELMRVGGAGAARVARQLGLLAGWTGDSVADAHAVVFTGHMIDAPMREVERFPARAEGAARAAIRQALLRMERASLVGVAGGASGGDLLFHEVCAELGVETLLRLTLPAEQFVKVSVAPAGAEWVERFWALVARLGEGRVKVLGKTPELPGWMGARANYDVWQRTNLWLVEEAVALAEARTLLALWDGGPGDGPGGTQHLVKAAAEYGLRVAPVIRTQMLLGNISGARVKR